jgi:ubiquinone/menaquinone biosynthesis C-methylase UbiE
LFSWLQGAEFYRALHAEAVAALPPGEGRAWLDVGTGPGLVARLAAARGYDTLGIDADAQMIAAAVRLAQHAGARTEFRQMPLQDLVARGCQTDVVSAASLLVVLDDPVAGLEMLWRCVRPGGQLLIIEATARLTVETAGLAIRHGLPRRRRSGLRLWAAVRQGRTWDARLLDALDAAERRFLPLLDGLVGAWVLRKAVV